MLLKDGLKYKIGGNNKKMVLKKRYSIKLVGHDYVTAWENDKKVAGSNEPDLKGDGVAIWVHDYEDNKPTEEKIGDLN